MWTPWAAIMTRMARYTYACKSGMKVIGVTNCFMIGFKACSKGQNTCLVLQRNQWLGRSQYSGVILLRLLCWMDNIKMLSKFLSRHPWISVEVIREVAWCSGPWLMLRVTTGQSAERKPQRSAQPQMGHWYCTLSLKLRDHHRRWKVLGVRSWED